MKKLLVSDYDFTFYLNDDDFEINKKNVDKFIKFGNLFVIATGTSYYDFFIKTKGHSFYYDYIILNHGATIINSKNEILYNENVPNEIISELKKDLELEKSKYTYCSKKDSECDLNDKNITKIGIKYKTQEDADAIAEKINLKYNKFVVAYSVPTFCVEIVSNKTNKALAIYKIMELEKISKGNVHTIGDGHNDIEMIKAFNGYAMENSVDELKQVTTKVVKSVSNLIEIVLDNKH